MLPGVEEEVKRFYSELNIELPVVRNPFIHREHITSWKKKFEVRRKIAYCLKLLQIDYFSLSLLTHHMTMVL